jgi:hypothetical protein
MRGLSATLTPPHKSAGWVPQAPACDVSHFHERTRRWPSPAAWSRCHPRVRVRPVELDGRRRNRTAGARSNAGPRLRHAGRRRTLIGAISADREARTREPSTAVHDHDAAQEIPHGLTAIEAGQALLNDFEPALPPVSLMTKYPSGPWLNQQPRPVPKTRRGPARTGPRYWSGRTCPVRDTRHAPRWARKVS